MIVVFIECVPLQRAQVYKQDQVRHHSNYLEASKIHEDSA